MLKKKPTWRSIVWTAARRFRGTPTPAQLYPLIARELKATRPSVMAWGPSGQLNELSVNSRAKVRQVLGELRSSGLVGPETRRSEIIVAAVQQDRNPWQIRDAQRREAGTCISCADKAIPGTGRCTYHREYSRQNCKQWGRKTNHGADATKLRYYRTSKRMEQQVHAGLTFAQKAGR